MEAGGLKPAALCLHGLGVDAVPRSCSFKDAGRAKAVSIGTNLGPI